MIKRKETIMEKKLYNHPEVAVSRLELSVVICTSAESGLDDNTISFNPEFSSNPDDAI